MTVALSGIPLIETERLVLRAPGPQDWEPYAAFILSDRADFIRPAEFDRGLAWRAFCHATGMWVVRGYGSFVIADRVTGATLGMTGPWHPEGWPEPEIGWTIWSTEAEGKGIAAEAARAAIDFAFRDLGWPTAVSYIAPGNERSIALAKRLGAVQDTTAPRPGDGSAMVFRHPKPEALA